MREGGQQVPRISVIIPALDEAETIGATVAAAVCLPGGPEVIVVDGGSSDATTAVAARHGAHIVTAARGRGAQMHAGALVAAGDLLWFLHADTLPPADAIAQMTEASKDDRTIGGNFQIRFDGEFTSARFLTWLYRYLALTGLRYGDSGYFVRRDAYIAVGGFRPFPIFEDLDLLRRLRRRGRFVRLPATVTTSSRRFEGRWFVLVFGRWTVMQVLYWLGVPPVRIGSIYAHVRSPAAAKQAPRPPAPAAAA